MGHRVSSLVDVGCGDAFVCSTLAEEFDDTNIHAIDPGANSRPHRSIQ